VKGKHRSFAESIVEVVLLFKFVIKYALIEQVLKYFLCPRRIEISFLK
jgi:hypothetical protein